MRRYSTIAVLAGLLALTTSGEAGAGGGTSGECLGSPSAPAPGIIYVIDSCFLPRDVTIQPGETLTWSPGAPNAPSELPHTVTFQEGLDSGDLAGPMGVRFNQPGTYLYFCQYHGGIQNGTTVGMAGTVTVVGEPEDVSLPALEVSRDGDPALFGGQASGFGTELASSSSALPAEMKVNLRLDPAIAILLVLLGLALGLGAGAVPLRRR